MTEAWSATQQQGFALAAAAHADPGAFRARAGLASASVAEATAVARALADMDGPARRRWVRARLAPQALSAAQSTRALPPRALGLLAASAPREIGRRWLADCPTPRPGYAPDPRLLQLLLQLARAHDARTEPAA